MKLCHRLLLLATLFPMAWGTRNLWAQDNAGAPSVLHIQHSVTTSQTGFPQYLYMYHLLDGAKSPAAAQGLTGKVSLRNDSANFSEVLWLLVYWEGQCPANDQSLAGAHYLWSDILKNPSASVSDLRVDLHFPRSLPMTGCVGLVFGGGPWLQVRLRCRPILT